jgi:hypothetical protein
MIKCPKCDSIAMLFRYTIDIDIDDTEYNGEALVTRQYVCNDCRHSFMTEQVYIPNDNEKTREEDE